MANAIHFYTHPYTRGATVAWMLEEIDQPFDVTLLNYKNEDHKKPEYLALNPMGKIPTLVHKGIVITETAAICAYLADAFPEKKLAPSITDPKRGTYLRWLFFTAGACEYAMVDKISDRAPVEPGRIGYGSYEVAFQTLAGALEQGPYLLGEQFSAADVFICSLLNWGTMMKAIPDNPIFSNYIKTCLERPAYQSSFRQGQLWLKQLEA